MASIATIKVKNEDIESGFMIINESDFDAGKHELFEEEEQLTDDEVKEFTDAAIADLTKIKAIEAIDAAVKSLDPTDSVDFTSTGSPRVARVEEILGHDVTSDDVSASWDRVKE